MAYVGRRAHGRRVALEPVDVTYTVIPVQPQANQSFTCILDNQSTQVTLKTTDYGLFMTVIYAGAAVATSRLCLDRTNINSAEYNGMPQALFFADLQGQSDPFWTGFGTRYVLCYGNPPESESVGELAFVSGSPGRLGIDFTLGRSILG